MFMEKITIKPVWFDSLGAKSSHGTGVKGCIQQKEATFCHKVPVPLSHRLREGKRRGKFKILFLDYILTRVHSIQIRGGEDG